MKRSIIAAGYEFSQLLHRGWVLASAAATSLLCLTLEPSRAAIGSMATGGFGSSISNLVLLLSALASSLVAALSFAADEEGGMAALIRSLAPGKGGLLLGKYLGILAAISAAAVAGLAFDAAAARIAAIAGSASDFARLALTAIASAAVYSAWGALFGSLCRSQLSAAGGALAFWFFTMFLYEAIGWALLPALPYRAAKSALALFLALDPAEALRLGSTFLGGQGAALGPDFYYWQRFFLSLPGVLAALALLSAHIALPLGLAAGRIGRRA
jgi:Cu-processing system permease protein